MRKILTILAVFLPILASSQHLTTRYEQTNGQQTSTYPEVIRYSPYVFEDTGAEWLSHHPEVQEALQKKRAADSTFANSASAQLEFIFKNSPYAEPEYMRYPVYRVK